MEGPWSNREILSVTLLAIVAGIFAVGGAGALMTGQAGRWKDGKELTPQEAVFADVVPLALGLMGLSYVLYLFFARR